MNKVFLGILILGGISVGAYFLLNDNNSFRISFFGQGAHTPLITSTTSSTTTATTTGNGKNVVRTVQDDVISTVQNVGSWIGEKSKQIFSSVTGGIQSTIESGAKDAAHSALTSVESALGISSESSNTPLSVSYVASSGSKISFVVRDPIFSAASSSSKELVAYSIDWGDGIIESKKDILAQDVYTFSHAWQKSGDYTILFKVSFSSKESSYTTHITIR